MNKKNLQIGLMILGILILAASGALLWINQAEPEQPQPQTQAQPEDNISMTKEEAIKQAENFQTDDICLMVITEAVHVETGAEYTFPNSCMPPGWKPVRN